LNSKVLLTILLFIAGIMNSFGEDRFYHKVFANSPQSANIRLSLFYDGRNLGEVESRLSQDDRLLGVKKSEILVFLSGIVKSSVMKELESVPGNALTTDNFKNAGVNVKYDFRNLRLILAVPPERKKTSTIDFGSYSIPEWSRDAMAPTRYSGYINWRAWKTYTPDLGGEPPLRVDFDSNFHLSRINMEGQNSYKEGEKRKWQRGDWRLIHDIPKRMWRFSAGDLNNSLTSFQVNRQMAGISFASEFSTNPYQQTLPLGQQEFYLLSESDVNIHINGRLIRRVRLPAGRHLLKDIPVGNGINDVLLKIRDQSGKESILKFKNSVSDLLLQRGLHRFSYGIGAPSEDVDGKRVYKSMSDHGTVSLFHQYGFSSNFTAGILGQADPDQHLEGLEIIKGTSYGNFSLSGATSVDGQKYSGHAYSVDYQLIDYHGLANSIRRFAFRYQGFSPRFAYLGESGKTRTGLHKFMISYGTGLWWRLSGNLGVDYTLNNNPAEKDPWSVTLSFIKQITKGMRSTIYLGRRQISDGSSDKYIMFFINYVLPGGHHNVNAHVDTLAKRQRVDYSYHSPQVVGGTNLRASVENVEKVQKTLIESDYKHQKFRLRTGWDGEGKTDGLKKKHINNRLNFHLASAFVFAGRTFAISRPVTDSFVIVKAKNTLSGQTVLVNSHPEYSEASTSMLGPAVLPNYLSYHFSTVRLSPELLDVGYNLGRENYKIRPYYRTGHVIVAGKDAQIAVTGTLVGPGGKPLSLKVGEIEKAGKTITFFTNRSGKFLIEELNTGSFKIRLYDQSFEPATMNIEEGFTGIRKMGNIIIKRKK
jgi:outer membrane usher protein